MKMIFGVLIVLILGIWFLSILLEGNLPGAAQREGESFSTFLYSFFPSEKLTQACMGFLPRLHQSPSISVRSESFFQPGVR